MFNARERAKSLGTLDAIDRSRQYTLPDLPEVLRSLNEAFTKIRILESGRRKDAEIIKKLHDRLTRYHSVTIALTSILTGLAWEGLRALLAHLLR